ncbi:MULTISPECIES: hypothetical protein [Nocardia]|uniref:hypothetical protein n=1 Tax=Nocardia TaxID=1817 RepID=UPI000AFCDB40|nr:MULTISPECIES: hypothetical protein [Nocardia]
MSDAPANVPAPTGSTQPAAGTASASLDATPATAETEPATAATASPAPGAGNHTPAAERRSVAADTGATDEPIRLTIEQIGSFEDLLRYLLDLEGDLKPFALAKHSTPRKALALPVDFDKFQEPIAALAARDTKLATALALMVTADRSELTGRPRQNVAHLAARILQRHMAFTDDDGMRDRLFRLLDGDSDPETLERTLVRIQNLLGQDFDGKKSMKSPTLHALADNAAHTVVLIAASAATWDVAHCVDALADNIWGAGNSGAESTRDREKLASLPKGARAAAALIVDSARLRLRAAEAERDRAATHLDIAQAQLVRLSEELDAARVRETELEAQYERLRSTLEQEAHARLSERMGAASDFETMRIDTVRVIGQQIESLEDALDALHHGQTQITEEFVRRSIKKLQQRLSALRPRTKQDPGGEQE